MMAWGKTARMKPSKLDCQGEGVSKKSVHEVAMRLLAIREHSSHEMTRKLKQKGFDNREIENVLAFLVAENLLSNERFLEGFINSKRNRGYGPLRIQQELQQHQIQQDLIDTYLDFSDPQWIADARQVRAKKFGTGVPEEFRDKARQMQFLQYRGFNQDQIKQVMNADDELLYSDSF